MMAGMHTLQGLVVWVLSTSFRLPVTANYLTFDEQGQTLVPATTRLFELPLVWLVVAFFFMSAAAHLIIATVYQRRYERGLQQGINRARWIEYALSASTMMVAIALLVGVYDLSSLLMIFVLTAVMNLMGLVMEVHNQTTERTSWLSYRIGVLAGAVPWLVIATYFWVSSVQGSSPPAFVYGIFISIFVFFNCFALNMYLQYKRVGKWRHYLYGERAYILLSLVAKSALAWQVFAGTLRP